MAEISQFREVGEGVLGGLIRGGIYAIGLLLLGVAIISTIFIVRYYRQFNIKVRIKTKRGSGIDGKPVYKIFYDKGGIIYNKKDKRSFFRILKEKIDLPVPPFETLQILANGGNEVEIVKESDSEYYYSLPAEMQKGFTIKDGRIVEKKQGKFVKTRLKIIESDVSYWNTLRKKDNRKLFDTEGLLMKVLPFAIIFLMVISVIFFTYIWLDKAPEAISILRQAAEALENAAETLAKTTTAQVTGG